MALAMIMAVSKLNFPCRKRAFQSEPTTRFDVRSVGCTPPLVQQQVESGVVCEPCGGAGWLLCAFCKGQKTNVKAADTNRIYRRCPACKSMGSILCSKCKVYRCVTFPDHGDGVDLNF